MGYSPWGHNESDTTEPITEPITEPHFHLHGAYVLEVETEAKDEN